VALGALGLFARPEIGAFAAALAGAAVLARSRLSPATVRAALLGFVGACAAAIAWATWLFATVGAPVPNGWFVKGGGSTTGFAYLTNQVLSWQPWIVGIGPLLLAAWAVRREVRKGGAQVTVVVAASVAALVAIAVSRPFHDGVQFFEARYFAPFVAIPVLAVAFGIASLPRWIAVLLVVPGIALTSVQVGDTLTRIRGAADDTRVLHTQVARFVAANLPPDAIVAVEGAGALRYHTPRTMTIVDLVGLNDHVAARLHTDRTAKQCHWIARGPTHAVVPAHWLPILAETFELAPIAAFDDEAYTQVEPVGPMRVVVVALAAVHPAAAPPRCPWCC
jgi:hypothetical protein